MTITKNVWKIAALLVVLSLISFTMLSGTYAKYSSTFAGTDTALVAKWEFTGSGDGFTINNDGSDTLTLNLFEHTFVDNIRPTGPGGAYIIAPGVSGDFEIVVTNNSDVAATVTFALSKAADSANVPIQYSLTEAVGGGGDFTDPLDEAELDDELDDAFSTLDPDAATASQTVYWRWQLSSGAAGDAVDTGLGQDSAEGVDRTFYGLTITLTAEQIPPEE
jgi:hypothetical protein